MGHGMPEWVERDFRGYLECGILAHGFARARCEDCGHERLIPFSCKGRGICPSCNARRMCEVAAHLADHVLPHVPTRQWVLSVPKRLRPYLHHDVRVAGGVLQIFLRPIHTTLRRASPGAPSEAQLGAVSFFHRFGSSLNVHPHYHLVVLDGVFGEAGGGEVGFHEACDMTPDQIRRVESALQRRVLRYFRRHKLLDELDAAGMLTWQGSGGFSVDASVRIEGGDRAGIERLVRYCARPPFALERLHALDSTTALASPESRVLYRFPKPVYRGAPSSPSGDIQFYAPIVDMTEAVAGRMRVESSTWSWHGQTDTGADHGRWSDGREGGVGAAGGLPARGDGRGPTPPVPEASGWRG